MAYKQEMISGIFIICSLFTQVYANTQMNRNVCFLPNQACVNKIIDSINHARRSIYLQANNLTSDQITRALVNAKHRGVEVNLLLDKSQWQIASPSASRYLAAEGIAVWIDYSDKKANINLVIVDKGNLIIGGINYHDNDSKKINDHVLFIQDQKLTKQYLLNWFARKEKAKKLPCPMNFGLESTYRRTFDPHTAIKVFLQLKN